MLGAASVWEFMQVAHFVNTTDESGKEREREKERRGREKEKETKVKIKRGLK